jgi:hypothetical protein
MRNRRVFYDSDTCLAVFTHGILITLAWPFIPFLCYMQKREENLKNKPE